MNADTSPPGWNLSRRDFIKIAAGLSWVAATTGLGAGLAAGTVLRSDSAISQTIRQTLDAAMFGSAGVASADTPMRIIDIMNTGRGEPLDLSLESHRFRPIVDQLTGGDAGIISYRDLLRSITKEKIILWGEAHFNDGDKVALRETIEAIRTANPNRRIVLALGRFMPEDDVALNDFVNNSSLLSDDEAIRQLESRSSYHKHWDVQLLSESTDPAKQFRLTLLMCRKNRIQLVGLGVDQGLENGIVQGEVGEQSPEEIASLENTAADIIFNLHQKNQNAIIIAQAGRAHVIRGAQDQGIAPKLERRLSVNLLPFAQPTRVVAVQTGDPSFLDSRILASEMNAAFGETLEHHQNILNNSAFAVKRPNFASARLDDSNKPVRRLPGADFLVVRYIGNGWTTLGQLNKKTPLPA